MSSFRRDTAFYIRQLMDRVPSMLAYWDTELRCRFANRAYERWFGVNPDALIGTTLPDLLGPELYRLNEPMIQGALRGEEQQFERTLSNPDGGVRHSLALYLPDIVDGKVLGFQVQVTEVTALKQTQFALREEIARREHALQLLRSSESALREAQRLGRLGSWEWEAASDITIWSEELYHLFGFDPKRLPPPHSMSARRYTAESWALVTAAVERALKLGEPYVLELEYFRAAGGTGWIEARGEAVRDESGEITRLRGTVLEITDRRRALLAEVQRNVATEASRSKTDFLSRVSHELRGPLDVILDLARQLQADPETSSRQREQVEAIVDRSQHVTTLVDGLLDLSGIELGHVALQRIDLDGATLLRDSVSRLAPVANQAGIELVNTLTQGASLPLRGDPDRLRQVVDELVASAIRRARVDGHVTLAAQRVDQGIELSVSDDGASLTDAQQARLFTPFDAPADEQDGRDGSGIGLALAHSLVGRMGGRIRVESRPGAGSRLVVTLPDAGA